ncbi:MAG: penicillin-binding protein 2 [Solirubrobacteraceae bacterium]
MIERPVDNRPPLSPQLALRVAVFGGIALVLFGVVLFRLWYLEVLSGDQYVQLANNNRVRDIRIQAPRGVVVDRSGATIVDNRPATAVQIVRDELPTDPGAQQLVFRRLGHVLQMSPAAISLAVNPPLAPGGIAVTPKYANVTLKQDAGRAVLIYLAEHQEQFPGVATPQVFLRRYPFRDVAAQLLGNVGEVSPKELLLPKFKDVGQGAVVGQTGIEWAYDHYLRGRDGATRVQVDAAGNARGTLAQASPVAGHQLKLSVDLGLQREGQAALQQGIGLAQGNGHAASAGAFVALDPRNGEVLAMGSAPSFDPNVFAKPLSKAKAKQIFGAPGSKLAGPQFNRAISSGYPTGSTFKPITAMASLQSGLITPDTPFDDTGCISVGLNHQQFCNAGKAVNGTVSLRDAIKVSSDVFFYTLGERANSLQGGVIQTWAKKLGLGRPTGIDLPGENPGLIPDAAWRRSINQRELQCEQRTHKPSCAISDGRAWTVGDNVNFAVGQGDLQATPLQMAVAYSAIANGGTIVRPHLGLEIDDTQGRLVQRIQPGAARHVDFGSTNQQAILDGLRLAASAPGGTSAEVFKDFPRTVYGKTGTAQYTYQDDQSWYVAYAPDPQRPIVIAMTIEKGGFGAEAAAPAVRLMLSQWFHVAKKVVAGHSRTR